MGETFFSSPQRQAAAYTGPDRLHAAFNFEFLGNNRLFPAHGLVCARFASEIQRWEHALGIDSWPNYCA